MILRFTVNDNDYQDLFENFCDPSFVWNLLFNSQLDGSKDFQATWETFVRLEGVRNRLSCNCPLTDGDEQLILNRLRLMWEKFLCEHEDEFDTLCDSVSKLEFDSLKQHFDASIVPIFEEKDENGEVTYFFYPFTNFHNSISEYKSRVIG